MARRRYDDDYDDDYDDRPRRPRRPQKRRRFEDDYDDDYDDRPRRPRKKSGGGMLPIILIVGLVALLGVGTVAFFGWQGYSNAKARQYSANNMKQIALAMHNFHDAQIGFPRAASATQDGRPGLSWRVSLAPYLEEPGVYNLADFSKPWDDPRNTQLADRMPDVYRHPKGDAPPGHTYYQVVVGPRTMFQLPEQGSRPGEQSGVRIQGVPDGTSNTILVVEAATPVPWSQPLDLTFEEGRPLPEFGFHLWDGDGAHVAFVDGSVMFLSPEELHDQVTRAMLGRDDGLVVDLR